MVVSVLDEGFDAVDGEAARPFPMPIQDGFHAVISPGPIGISSGRLNDADVQSYLGCFRQAYGPDGSLAVDTRAWPGPPLCVRAIAPIGGNAYLMQAVSSARDGCGQVFTYSEREGVNPVEAPGSETGARMEATNARLRRMRNAGALKRQRR